MLINTIILPFLASFTSFLFGYFIGYRGVSFLTISSLVLSLLITIYYFIINPYVITYIYLYNWINLGSFSVSFELLFDQLTYIMLIVVLTISLIVHIYSTQYLKNDPHIVRFLTWLSLFTFFMLVLISSENLVQIFIGWEGVGICSYLLINFWYTRIQANKAALKAIFVNKIGDIFLLFAIVLCYFLFGSTSFSVIFPLLPYVTTINLIIGNITINILNLIGFCFVIGAVGKSAQIGLHIWLPDAMEGPTPVSALLHAATMVTAGVFLVIRLSYLFEYTPVILNLILIIGAITAFFASTIGLLQYDLKRIIAFSTCSQLGYMFVACGLSQYSLALFHLFNHAFFKALLFLAAGNVIHALSDEQDIRKMGGLANLMPLTFSFFLIASLSLMGFPFLSGFYSKDLLIEFTWVNSLSSHYIAVILLITAAFFTAAYSLRLVYYVFLVKPNFGKFNLNFLGEANTLTQIPLIFLCICSICTGFLFNDLFVGINSDFLLNSILGSPKKNVLIEHEYLVVFFKQLPFLVSFGGVFLMYQILIRYNVIQYYFSNFVIYNFLRFLNQKWFFDKLYNHFLTQKLINLFYNFYIFLDKGILEFIGPTGFYNFNNKISLLVIKYQTGNLGDYFFYMFCSFSILLLIFIFFF